MTATPATGQFTTAFLEDAFTFTPVRKRKLRPSLSPVETVSQAKAETQKRVKRNSDGSMRQNVLQQPSPSYDIPTAALNFRDFSFLGEDGRYSMNNVSDKEQNVLLSYLADIYSVTGMYIEPPFLHLVCEELPPENERPFTIAGFIAVWSSHDDEHIGNFFLGYYGEGKDISLPEHIANDIQEQRIPSDDTILYLAEHVFKDAIAIALVWHSLVVCLPEMTDLDFAARLQELPRDLTACDIPFLQYHNGYLPHSEFRRREIQPNPTSLTGQSDEFDYVAADNRFYPGTMIQSCDEKGTISSVTAGILVSKAGETRLTASYHCWQDIIEKNPDIMPQGAPVYQGNNGNSRGTYVGDLERVGKSDVALVKLREPFENSFMELDYSPKKLLHTNNVIMGDEFLIDSFVTGKQRLKCVGLNRYIERKRQSSHPQLQGDPKDLPSVNLPYIGLNQGLFATNTPHIPTTPRIREGVCGAVLLRCKMRNNTSLSSDEVLAIGEVAGIMHFADLRPKYSTTNNLLCYADTFNELIDQGWEVAARA